MTGVVALAEPLLAQLDEEVERVAAVGDGELGEQDPVELDLDVAALRDLERAPQRVALAGEVAGHLLGGLEVEVVGLELPVVRVLERVARLDAEQRLVGARVLVAQVVDVAGRDGREARRRRELDELRQDPLLHVEVGVLELDVDVVAPEDLREPVELGGARRRCGSPRAPCRRGPHRQPESAITPAACRSSSSQSTRGL